MPKAVLNSLSALTPFWTNASGFWSSDAIRDTTRLGYTYPDFIGINTSSKDTIRAAIGQKVNQLYGDGSRNSFAFAAAGTGTTAADAAAITQDASKTQAAPEVAQQIFTAPTPATSGTSATPVPSTPPTQGTSSAPPKNMDDALHKVTDAIHTITLGATHAASVAASHAQQAVQQATGHQIPMMLAAQPPASGQRSVSPARSPAPAAPAPAPAHSSSGGQGHKYHDWAARIRFKKSEMHSSFSVLIFVGQVPDDPAKWRSSSSYVGSHYGLVNSEAEKCENCRDTDGNETEGYVHLNHWMATFSGLKSFEPEVVKPYLAKYMNWRIHMVFSIATRS